MAVPQIFTTYDKETLLLILDGFLSEFQRLNVELDRVNELNKKLLIENEELKRADSRQAAPFSKGKRKKRKKRPGRKVGKGIFRHKEDPLASEITEPPVDVPVTETQCPFCG